MLDGFQYVLAQIGFVVAVTALLAGVLGWLIGRGNRRRSAEKAAAQFASAAPVVPEEHAPDTAVAEAAPRHAVREPKAEPLIDHAPLHVTEEPEDPDQTDDLDRTVIRMPPTSGGSATTPYLPPTAVTMYSVPVAKPAPAMETVRVPVATIGEVQFLRQELRQRDLELGRIEAAALSAWDRTVPQLEGQIEDLGAENDTLWRRLRKAEEHSDADALNVAHLRTLIADRDAKIAELRAQG